MSLEKTIALGSEVALDHLTKVVSKGTEGYAVQSLVSDERATLIPRLDHAALLDSRESIAPHYLIEKHLNCVIGSVLHSFSTLFLTLIQRVDPIIYNT